MKLIAVDPEAGSPEFNRTAADAVYKAMTAMDPDAALVYGRILLADSIRYDLVDHREGLAKIAQAVVGERAATLRRHYTRTAVAKARRGEDSTGEIACLVQISKAGFDHLSTAERRKYAQKRTRDAGGRFTQEHIRIDTDPTRSPLDQKDAVKREGIPEASNLGGRDLTHYQQAYKQIQDMLGPFHHQDLNAVLHLNIAARSGDERTEQVAVAGKGKPTDVQSALKPGDRIKSAQVSMRPDPTTASGAVFDVLAAAGAPRVGGRVADAYGGGLSPGRLGEFNQARQKVGDNEPFSASSRAFGRLERGGALLRDSLGENPPASLQYAAAVANHVGQFGPEAQKVIGPAADRAAYRYRGTERALDPKLKNAFDVLNRAGVTGGRARDVVLGGLGGDKRSDGWNPGPVLDYFRGQLPNPDLNELQRRSGVIPPSEGIIIGPHGKVAHQSIGYADDWYLPFNLRHLSALKGGEYIRTRSFGGPTTEDIYTGLISGARSMTVVSHNGVYTVDFDRNLRGGRRFNDKAGRMVARYGQLLDAVRSGQVGQGGISPSRLSQLAGEARDFDSSPEGFKAKFRELQAAERQDPRLSDQESAAVAEDWLAAVASEGVDRDATSPKALTDKLIEGKARSAYLADRTMATQMGVDQVHSLDDFRASVSAQVQTGTATDQARNVADLLGRTAEFDQAIKEATDANAKRVASLKLDGAGYEAALLALQEQFPYYIAGVKYRPWKEARGIGDRTRERARDTGYVAPRFNRPQAAEAGYFNRDVTGRGKVDAQSIRYQNFRVGGGKLTDHRLKERAGSAGDEATAAAAAPAPAVSDADRLRGANAALLDDILAKERFDTGATLAGLSQSGRLIRREIDYDNFPSPALQRVFSTPRAVLEAETTPEELQSLLMEIAALSQGREKVFALDDAKVRAVRNNGRVEPPRPAPALLGSMLDEVASDHVFPGQAYDAARLVAPDVIERTFDGEPTIARLVTAGHLLGVSDPAFDSKVGPLAQRLRDADAEHTRLAGVGGRPDTRQDLRDAEGLLRATQLRRRWVDADKNRPAPPAAAGTNTTNLTIVAPSDGISPEMRQQLNQMFGVGVTPAVGNP